MSGIYWSQGAGVDLKNYSSATRRDGVSTVKIELTTRDPYELSSILGQLNEIDTERRRAELELKEAERMAKAATRRRPAPRGKMIDVTPLEPTFLLEDRRTRR